MADKQAGVHRGQREASRGGICEAALGRKGK